LEYKSRALRTQKGVVPHSPPTPPLQLDRIKTENRLLFFSGASPIRRDPGRGLTAAQWARYCGRIVCADSIDKFVRTAVPGGGDPALAGAASTELKSVMSIKGGKSGGKEKFPFRSKSTGSRHKAGWLSRKLKKAFHHNAAPNEANEDIDDGLECLSTSAPTAMTASPASSGKKNREELDKFKNEGL
jgi:hypothetical protein